MTVATMTPRVTVTLPVERAPLPFPLDEWLVLVRRCHPRDPAFTITMNEACPACDGEGRVMLAVPGGVWTNSQGGMWEPSEREEECVECEGRQTFDRTRCLACGGIHDTDEWGLHAHERACDCDPEDVLAAIDALDRTCVVLGHVAAAHRAAVDAGMSTAAAVHRVPWPHMLALAARSEARITRHAAARGIDAFYSTDVAWGDAVISLYASENGVV